MAQSIYVSAVVVTKNGGRMTPEQEREYRKHATINDAPMSVALAEIDAQRERIAKLERLLTAINFGDITGAVMQSKIYEALKGNR